MITYSMLDNNPAIRLDVQKTLSASATTENLNLFKLTGNVKIKKIYGVLEEKTTLTNMTDCGFGLYDGSAEVAITKLTTLAMSTAVVGAIVAKTAPNTAIATFLPATVGGVIEGASLSKVDYEFIITKKNGANTYIRFNYTTTDAPIDAKMRFYVEYESIDGGYLEVA